MVNETGAVSARTPVEKYSAPILFYEPTFHYSTHLPKQLSYRQIIPRYKDIAGSRVRHEFHTVVGVGRMFPNLPVCSGGACVRR